MSDTFSYCGCQYEPSAEFQKEHWHEDKETGVTHCDLCDLDIGQEIKEYGID